MKGFTVRRNFILSAFAVASLVMAAGHGTAFAQAATGTAPEAEAQVKAAVAFIKANGPQKAYEEFTNGTKFKDRDLYITVYDFAGKNLAHGSNPKMVGKELLGLKDFNGVPIIENSRKLAQEKGKGWSDVYHMQNPLTKKLQAKKAYVERVGDTFVSSGIYIQE